MITVSSRTCLRVGESSCADDEFPAYIRTAVYAVNIVFLIFSIAILSAAIDLRHFLSAKHLGPDTFRRPQKSIHNIGCKMRNRESSVAPFHN